MCPAQAKCWQACYTLLQVLKLQNGEGSILAYNAVLSAAAGSPEGSADSLAEKDDAVLAWKWSMRIFHELWDSATSADIISPRLNRIRS